MGLVDRLGVLAARYSWSAYHRINSQATRQLGPRTIRIPVRTQLGLENLEHDTRWMRNVISRCTAAGASGYYVDVGANLGQCLIAMLETDLPTRYIAFEPDLDAAAYIAEFMRLNDIADGAILPIALGAEHGLGVMRTSTRAGVGSSLDRHITPDQMYRNEVRVPLSTGDVQLAHVPDHAFLVIKIDVEGFELSVLKGLEATVRRAKPPLYVEVLGFDHFLDGSYGRDYFGELTRAQIDALVEARVANGVAVERWLRDHDYDLFMDSPSGFAPIRSIELGDSRPGRQGERNVLALSASRSNGR